MAGTAHRAGLSAAALPLGLAAAVLAVLGWSVVQPHDYPTWLLEAGPVLVALPLLAATYRRFPLTGLVYVLIAVHCAILLVGAHYTYARVPAFDWLQAEWDLARNHYDRAGHFTQGFVPAMIARELLLRTSPLRPGRWLFVIVVLSCLGISAAYELLEWAVAASMTDGAEDFLGTQGDVWDTQKDMALALAGAVAALLLLGRLHDRALERFQAERNRVA